MKSLNFLYLALATSALVGAVPNPNPLNDLSVVRYLVHYVLV